MLGERGNGWLDSSAAAVLGGGRGWGEVPVAPGAVEGGGVTGGRAASLAFRAGCVTGAGPVMGGPAFEAGDAIGRVAFEGLVSSGEAAFGPAAAWPIADDVKGDPEATEGTPAASKGTSAKSKGNKDAG